MTDYFGDEFRDIVFKWMFGIKLTEAERKRLFSDGTSDPKPDKECKEDTLKTSRDIVKLQYWSGKAKEK